MRPGPSRLDDKRQRLLMADRVRPPTTAYLHSASRNRDLTDCEVKSKPEPTLSANLRYPVPIIRNCSNAAARVCLPLFRCIEVTAEWK